MLVELLLHSIMILFGACVSYASLLAWRRDGVSPVVGVVGYAFAAFILLFSVMDGIALLIIT